MYDIIFIIIKSLIGREIIRNKSNMCKQARVVIAKYIQACVYYSDRICDLFADYSYLASDK